MRPFDTEPTALVSPCDAKLSAYEITRNGVFNIKGFDYTVESLLRNAELAEKFIGGLCLVFRLTVTDYHRYFFFDGGVADGNTFYKRAVAYRSARRARKAASVYGELPRVYRARNG